MQQTRQYIYLTTEEMYRPIAQSTVFQAGVSTLCVKVMVNQNSVLAFLTGELSMEEKTYLLFPRRTRPPKPSSFNASACTKTCNFHVLQKNSPELKFTGIRIDTVINMIGSFI